MAKTNPADIHEKISRDTPPLDPYQILHTLSHLPYLDYGTVVHCLPLHRVYHVQPYRGGPIRLCKMLTRGPTGLVGPYDADTLPPLTPVWFINVPDSQYGYIIGCEPPYLTSGQQYYGDAVVRDSRVGLDEEVDYWLAYGAGGQLPAFSGRTPVDSVETGEFCRVAETGTMLFLDSFLAMLKAGDTCGVMAHFPNKLLRLLGRHVQQWSAISAAEHYVSPQGLSVIVGGVSSNVQESIGIIQDVSRYDPTAPVHPQNVSSFGRPLYRDVTLSGGIIDGEAKVICAVQPESTKANYGSAIERPVSLSYRSYNGQMIHASCSGIHFVKTDKFFGVIPVQPMTSSPDTKHPKEAYESSNILSTGKEEIDADIKPINILDQHYILLRAAMERGQRGGAAFSLVNCLEGNEPTSLKSIKASSTLARPMADYRVHKDPANREFLISSNVGYMGILDDGSVCLSDGWGAEIRLSRGCVYITAPLDIYLDAGRNVVAFAGRDAILKAYKAMDLSTSHGDMRLKAEANLHMLGANAGGDYGVLIESRSSLATSYQEGVGTSARYPGVNIVANTSNIILKAENIASYAAASIIDAAPSGVIIRSGDKIVDRTSCVIAQVFEYDQRDRSYKEIADCEQLPTPGSYYKGPRYNLFTYQSTVLDGELMVKGDIAVYNDVIVGGHVYTSGDLLIDSQFARNTRNALKTAGLGLGSAMMSAVDGTWLKSSLATYAANLFFTCRTDDDYQNTDFVYPEGRWTMDQDEEWDEPAVVVEFVDVNCKSGQGSSGSESNKNNQQVTSWPFPGAKYYDKKAPKAVIRSEPNLNANMSQGAYKPNVSQVPMKHKRRLG